MECKGCCALHGVGRLGFSFPALEANVRVIFLQEREDLGWLTRHLRHH